MRTALERLEEYGLVSRGEETTVKLSIDGSELAEVLYRQHEPLRNEMINNGLDVFAAEQQSLKSPTTQDI